MIARDDTLALLVATLCGAVGFVALMVAPFFIVLAFIKRAERRAAERLRANGIPCTAYVRSYRRVSMTQHRVLFEIHLPTGPIGREYTLTNLSDPWLADVCALRRPVRALAHPDADTILLG